MDLENAIGAHAEWKIKLRAAITNKGSVDAATLSADDKCALGKWLYGEAKGKYNKLPAYTECISSHAAFHKAAAQVAREIEAKRYEQAAEMLEHGTPFASASTAVTLALMKLKKEAKL